MYGFKISEILNTLSKKEHILEGVCKLFPGLQTILEKTLLFCCPGLHLWEHNKNCGWQREKKIMRNIWKWLNEFLLKWVVVCNLTSIITMSIWSSIKCIILHWQCLHMHNFNRFLKFVTELIDKHESIRENQNLNRWTLQAFQAAPPKNLCILSVIPDQNLFLSWNKQRRF